MVKNSTNEATKKSRPFVVKHIGEMASVRNTEGQIVERNEKGKRASKKKSAAIVQDTLNESAAVVVLEQATPQENIQNGFVIPTVTDFPCQVTENPPEDNIEKVVKGPRYDWHTVYCALKHYQQARGHANVGFTESYECVLEGMGEDGSDVHYHGRLGRWLDNQRTAKRGTRGNKRLTVEREALLQELVDAGLMRWNANDAIVSSTYTVIGENGEEIIVADKDVLGAKRRRVGVGEVNWNRNFQALLAYGREHGHYNVPAQCRYDCVLEGLGDDGGDIHYFGRLGRWLDRQKCAKRGMKKTTKLTPEHEAQLQELVDKGLLRWDASAIRNMAKERRHSEGKGPKLPHVSLWSKHFAALKKYGEEHGHCNIPLGENYRCVLHGLGPDGEDYQYEGRLGKWLYAQRCAKKGVKDTKELTEDHNAQLQDLVDQGLLMWDVATSQASVTWADNFAALKKYGEELGNCNVPLRGSYECVLEGFGEGGAGLHYVGKLGIWLQIQRQMIAHKRMPADREALIQELIDAGHLNWEQTGIGLIMKNKQSSELMWPKHFAALCKYAEEKGHANVTLHEIYRCVLPGMGDDGSDLHYEGKLGRWLQDQRRMKKGTRGSKRLTAEREEKLQELVDQGLLLWDKSGSKVGLENKQLGDLTWPRHYAALKKYAEEHGNCNVPVHLVYKCVLEGMGEDGGDLHYEGKLGPWLSRQRGMQKRLRGSRTLLPEREALLQELVDRELLRW